MAWLEVFGCVKRQLRFRVSLGVWPEGSDGTDINALVRSHNRRVIAVADDFCKVHLFQYPCSKAKVSSLGDVLHNTPLPRFPFVMLEDGRFLVSCCFFLSQDLLALSS